MNISAVCLSIILVAALFSQASPAPSEYTQHLSLLSWGGFLLWLAVILKQNWKKLAAKAGNLCEELLLLSRDWSSFLTSFYLTDGFYC